MSRKPKIKVTKGKPKKMARGGTIQDGLVKPLEKGHGDTVKFIGGMRSAKNKMPGPIKRLFPDF
ncbi:MAG: hypothetical protein M3N18_02155 [Actinomycetota bacterium]|nr:hypothetical protein [Actinomycetota bacterium]